MSEAIWPPKGLVRGVANAAKGTGWTAWSASVSRVEDGVAFHAYEFAKEMRFLVKPIDWDRVLWRLLGHEVARAPSPSRYFRTDCSPVPPLAVGRITGGDPDDIGRQIVDFANAGFEGRRALPCPSFDEMMAARGGPRRADDHVVAELAMLLAEARHNEARQLCARVLAGEQRVGVMLSTPNGNVFELAKRALDDGSI